MKAFLKFILNSFIAGIIFWAVILFFIVPISQWNDKRAMRQLAEDQLQSLYRDIHYDGDATDLSIIGVEYYDHDGNHITSRMKFLGTKDKDLDRRISCRFAWRDAAKVGTTDVIYHITDSSEGKKLASREVIRSDAFTRQDMKALDEGATKFESFIKNLFK